MATGIGQYTPIFLPGEPPSLTEKPGRPQSIGSQRVGHYQSDPACIDARHFLPVAALLQWELSVKVAQLLGLQGPWWHQVFRDTDCLCHRSYGPIRVFFLAFYSWWSKGLFGQSFSVALTIQALRGRPCLRSFSVVQCIRHIKGPPWLGFYSVGQLVRHLKGQPGWALLCNSVHQAFDGPASLSFSCQCWHVVRERGDGSTRYMWLSSISLLPWLPGFPPQSLPPASHHNLLPHIPSSISPQSTAALALGFLHNP